MPPARDLTGRRFGRLTIVRSFVRDKKDSMCAVKCDCGIEKEVFRGNITSGRQLSCGCLRDEIVKTVNLKHGMRRHRLYKVWQDMKARTTNPNIHNFERYGGRGIRVCRSWKRNAGAFIAWALTHGWKRGLLLDRENNDGNYEPSNCRFVTAEISSNNRSPRRWRRRPV